MRVTIAVDRICRVVDARGYENFNQLYELFSVEDPGRFFNYKFKAGRWDGKFHHIWSDGRFAVGLLKDVVVAIRKLGDKVRVVIPARFRLNGFVEDLCDADGKLYDYQREAIEKMVGHQPPVGTIVLTTGAGKTEIMMDFIRCHPNLKFLYVCTRKLLASQTRKRMAAYLDEEVALISGEEKTPGSNIRRVVCCVDNSMSKMLKSFKPGSFDVIFIDECHRSSKYMKQIARHFNWKRMFGFTGSYPTRARNQMKYWKVRSFIGAPLYLKTDAEMRGTTEWMPNCTVYRIKNKIAEIPGTAGFKIYENYIKFNDERNTLLARLAKKLKYVLIVVNHTTHGKEIYSKCKRLGVNVRFIHSKVNSREAIRQLDQGEIDCLIATPIIDEGISINNIRHLLYAAGQTSEIQVIQRVGRGKRKKDIGENRLFIWDFADDGVKRTKHNSDLRFSTYKQITDKQFDVPLSKLFP